MLARLIALMGLSLFLSHGPVHAEAMQEAAALKQELTLPSVTQTVIITRLAGRTPVPEREKLSAIAQIGATMVIYLSVGMIEEVVSELLQGAYLPATTVAVVAKATWADEQIIEGSLADIAEKVKAAGIGKQALIIVGDVLKARKEGIPELSKLYDKNFSHGFRA